LNHIAGGGAGPLSHEITVIERIILPAGAPPRPNLPGAEMFMFSSNSAEVNAGHITFQEGSTSAPFASSIEDVCNNVGGDFASDGSAFIVPIYPGTTAGGDPGPPPVPAIGLPWKETLDIVDAEYVSNAVDGNVLEDDFTSTGRTALYSHTFDFTPEIFPIEGQVSLLFDYLSDNDLGKAGEEIGLLLNCKPIPLSAMLSDGQTTEPQFGEKPFFTQDQVEGVFDVTADKLLFGENTLQIYLRNHGGPAGIQYKASFGFDQCPAGEEVVPIEIEEGVNDLNGVNAQNGEELPPEFECKRISGTTGNSGHEPPTIGKSLDGVRQVVDGGISVDDQTWTVTQGYHQEFELLQMLSSPHTISNVVHCAKGVQYCNYIAVGFMGLTDDFNNPVMTVSASKDHLGSWTLDWYDPDDYISDPGDAAPADIVFVPQIIDNNLLGTSFTIDFKNKDTGQLKMGIQVRDSYGGVRNFFFNEGVEFIDADAYPAVNAAYEAPIEVESLCFGQNNPDRNSCQFSKIKDWATQNAEETLRQMMGNQYQYEQ